MDPEGECDWTSGLIWQMRERAEGHGEWGLVLPVVLDVFPLTKEDGSKDANAFAMGDRLGLVPTEEEFWSFVDLVARGYRQTTDAQIRDYNRQRIHERERGPDPAAARPQVRSTGKAKKPGYVYLLEGADGVYKIGWARDARKRTEVLRVELPFEVYLVASWRTDRPQQAERFVHDALADRRVNGEWFDFAGIAVEDVERAVEEEVGRFEDEAKPG